MMTLIILLYNNTSYWLLRLTKDKFYCHIKKQLSRKNIFVVFISSLAYYPTIFFSSVSIFSVALFAKAFLKYRAFIGCYNAVWNPMFNFVNIFPYWYNFFSWFVIIITCLVICNSRPVISYLSHCLFSLIKNIGESHSSLSEKVYLQQILIYFFIGIIFFCECELVCTHEWIKRTFMWLQ